MKKLKYILLNLLILNSAFIFTMQEENDNSSSESSSDEKEKNSKSQIDQILESQEARAEEIELIKAAGNGFHKKVENLLNKGVNINCSDKFGMTPLHHALENMRENVIDLLLDKGADIKSALWYAVKGFNSRARHHRNQINNNITDERKIKIFETLLAMGADVNVASKDYDLITQIFHHGNCVKELIEIVLKTGNYQNLNNNKLKFLPLNQIMQEGLSRVNYYYRGPLNINVSEVMQILIDAGADINLRDSNQKNAYDIAKKFEETKVIKVSKSNVNNWKYDNAKETKIIDLLKSNVNNWKLELYTAIKNSDYINFKKYLFKIGSICIKDEDGNNLLHYAFKYNNLDFAKLIYSIRPDLIARCNYKGECPLSNLHNQELFSFIDKMILEDARMILNNIKKRDEARKALLSNFDQESSNKLNEILKKRKIEDNNSYLEIKINKDELFLSYEKLIQDLKEKREALNNKNLLIDVLETKRIDIIKLILHSGIVNINEKNSHGNSALYYALEMDNEDLIKLFLIYGADINQNCEQNITILNLVKIYKPYNKFLSLINSFLNKKRKIS